MSSAYFEDSQFLPGSTSCPLLLGEAPGVMGSMSGRPEDFIVDEIPAYEASGQGPHWYVRIR